MKYNGKTYNYFISATGEVRNKRSMKVLGHRYTKQGDPLVQVRKGKKIVSIQIIKAIAQNFVPNPFGLGRAELEEGMPLHADNISWCGQKLSGDDIRLCKDLKKKMSVIKRAKIFSLSRQGVYDIDAL